MCKVFILILIPMLQLSKLNCFVFKVTKRFGSRQLSADLKDGLNSGWINVAKRPERSWSSRETSADRFNHPESSRREQPREVDELADNNISANKSFRRRPDNTVTPGNHYQGSDLGTKRRQEPLYISAPTPNRAYGRTNDNDGTANSSGRDTRLQQRGERGERSRSSSSAGNNSNQYRMERRSRQPPPFTPNSEERYYEKREPPAYGSYEGDHVYGMSPVKLALTSKKREFSELLIQDGLDPANKKDQKAASEILKLCQEEGIPTREFPKHDLNMLTDSRPHQGFVLRATPRVFSPIDSLPPTDTFKCVLVLDEVWDPQNFGALLRTSHYLGVDKVIVCAKNSAPLSPAVSKASSGAMEVMDIYSVNNLMRFLDKSQENGWQVIGTSLSESSVRIEQMKLEMPTILVLGNEGYGIRTNIIRRCNQQIKIPTYGSPRQTQDFDDAAEGMEQQTDFSADIDSLNVSVTGGIILHYILSSKHKD